jgi:hypothetical protein
MNFPFRTFELARPDIGGCSPLAFLSENLHFSR